MPAPLPITKWTVVDPAKSIPTAKEHSVTHVFKQIGKHISKFFHALIDLTKTAEQKDDASHKTFVKQSKKEKEEIQEARELQALLFKLEPVGPTKSDSSHSIHLTACHEEPAPSDTLSSASLPTVKQSSTIHPLSSFQTTLTKLSKDEEVELPQSRAPSFILSSASLSTPAATKLKPSSYVSPSPGKFTPSLATPTMRQSTLDFT